MGRFFVALALLLASSLSAQTHRIPESAWLDWRTLKTVLSPDSSGLRWWFRAGGPGRAEAQKEFYARFDPRAAEAWADSVRTFLAGPVDEADTIKTSLVLRSTTGDALYLARRKNKDAASKEFLIVMEAFDSDKPILVNADGSGLGEILESVMLVSRRTPFSAEVSRRADELVLLDPNRGKKVEPARARPDNAPPRYPTTELLAHTSGAVLVRFVISSNGKADLSTVDVLHATNSEFLKAVLDALPRLFFDPARLDGQPVRQIVTMPFQFTMVP